MWGPIHWNVIKTPVCVASAVADQCLKTLQRSGGQNSLREHLNCDALPNVTDSNSITRWLWQKVHPCLQAKSLENLFLSKNRSYSVADKWFKSFQQHEEHTKLSILNSAHIQSILYYTIAGTTKSIQSSNSTYEALKIAEMWNKFVHTKCKYTCTFKNRQCQVTITESTSMHMHIQEHTKYAHAHIEVHTRQQQEHTKWLAGLLVRVGLLASMANTPDSPLPFYLATSL